MMPSSRKLLLLALTAVLVSASIPAHAADQDATDKKRALIRLLVKAGKNEEAAANMRTLYPKGPPYGGALAIEYYDVIGNTEAGWEEAKDGLERLARASPQDVDYQLMLAKQLSRRAETRQRALRIYAELANRPDVGKQRVLGEWRDALTKLPSQAASIAAYKEYLAIDPGNAAVRDLLSGAQRAEAERLPWEMRNKADAQLAAGHPEEAMDTLRRAMQLDPKNAWVRFDLGRLYHKQGRQKEGREVMEAGIAAAPGDADMLYANALYVGLLDEADNALRLLDRIPPRERSQSMKRLYKKMDVTRQTQRAQELARDGKPAAMQAALRHAETDAGNDAELASIVANSWIDLGEPEHGVALMRKFLARRDASADTLIYVAKVLNRAEQNDELEAVLARAKASKNLSAGNREDLRYLNSALASHRADTLRKQGKIEEARQVLVVALKDDPRDTDMLMAKARVHDAAGEQEQARNIYRDILQREPGNAGAQRALDAMSEKPGMVASSAPADRHAQGYVAAGVDYLSKQGGTPGISNFSALELPVEARIPVGNSGGRMFAQVDPVWVDAGVLQTSDLYNARQYGKVLALSPAVAISPSSQSAQGKAVAVGYEGDGFRADIGSTPIGFPVSNVVGGLKWSHYTAVSGFSFDLSRRPMTSSLVAYAGAHDPVTGEVWGGVVSTGAGLHLSHDWGKLSLFVDPGYYRFTGQNVLDNTQIAVRTGFNWGFIDRDDMRLIAGMAVTYWNYRENLRYYSFGHGGYYSPQKYFSLALPVRWTGRQERWSYLLQGSVSASVSHEKDMPFYPTSPTLQAQGMANMGTMVPVYTGGNGHGTGFSFGGALEYKFTARLFGGVVGQIDRSAYYTPNYAILYLRYMFDAQTGEVPMPPDPVKAYSRY